MSALWNRFVRAWRALPHPLRWVGVAVVGGALLLAGLVFMVLPGPGIPLVLLGLVVLGSEFAWAQVLLHRVKDGSQKAASTARGLFSRFSRRS